MNRTFYHTTYTVEIVSEDPLPEACDAQDLANWTGPDGECMATVGHVAAEKLTGRQAAEVIRQMYGDPHFFFLDDQGNSTLIPSSKND